MASAGLLLPPPGPVDINGPNSAANWEIFYQKFQLYLTATGQTSAKDEVKCALLLSLIGEDALRTFNTFKFSGESTSQSYATVVEALKNYCSPKKNTTYERFKFAQRKWEEGEKFDNFLTALKTLVRHCDYGDQEESIIRDHIIQGCEDRALQEVLLRLEDTSLDKVAQHCRVVETSAMQAKQINAALSTNPGQPGLSVDALQSKFGKPRADGQVQTKKFMQGKQLSGGYKEEYLQCTRCSTKHRRRECPAWGKKCNKCGILNHFASSCKTKHVRSVQVNQDSDSDCFELHHLRVVSSLQSTNNLQVNQLQWKETIRVEGKAVILKLDTGSEVNVMPYTVFKKLDQQLKVRKTTARLEPYGGGKQIQPVGRVTLHCTAGNKEAYLDFYLVDCKADPLLGLSGCMELGYVQGIHCVSKNEAKDLIDTNSDLFTGLGSFPREHEISVEPNAPRFQHPSRRIAKSRLGPLQKELERLKNLGVIVKVTDPTPEGFISNIVIVDKPNGSVRICLDPVDLNKVIFKKRCVIKKLQDIQDKLDKKQYYSVFDFKEGFSQIRLSKNAMNYVMFSTPYGIYKYTRMPYGLSPAPEVFQEEVDKNFGHIPNCITYIDDIICYGVTEEEHNTAVQAVLDTARELGVKFNPNKVQYKQAEVKYVGHIFSAGGMSIDPERTRALMEIKPPKNLKELQSILGMFNYVRPFIKNMSQLEQPLQALRKSDGMWQWLPCHDVALTQLKEAVASAPCLRSFDPTVPITLQCDASQTGLGACLLQEGQPIAFASRKLTETEQHWAQIEKEMLSIVFGVTKFHEWMFGYSIRVVTDHKPLVPLMNKPVGKIGSTRLKRLRLKILPYNLSVSYLPGKEMYVADLLSRSYINDTVQDDVEMSQMVHSVSRNLAITTSRRTQFERETSQDPELQMLKKYYTLGWPEHKKGIDILVSAYWQIRNEIFVEEKLLFYNDRVIVPSKLRPEMLSLVHEGHCAVERSLARAGSIMYWPGWAKDVEMHVKKCESCEKYAPRNRKHEYLSREIPKLPYERVSADILDFGGKSYLVVNDAYSKWIDIAQLKGKSAEDVMDACKSIFSTHGDPQILLVDNVPFGSREFRNFAKDRFELQFSSPRYPQSNGFAEKGVHIAKQLLRKCSDSGTDYREALRAYRNMPIPGFGASPSELLNSRLVRTRLPLSNDQLQPKVQMGVNEWLSKREEQTREWYNRKAGRKESDFSAGQNVVERTTYDKVWKSGKIINKHNKAPRSYWVSNYRGNVVRRTSKDLKSSHNQYVPVKNYSDLTTKVSSTSSDHERDANDGSGATVQYDLATSGEEDEDWPGWGDSNSGVQLNKEIGETEPEEQTEARSKTTVSRSLRKVRKKTCTECI